jgi:hypothetical protein
MNIVCDNLDKSNASIKVYFMFSDIGPETSYRIVLRFLKGTTAKFLSNYELADERDYYRWLAKNKVSKKKVIYLKKQASKVHNYLNSLGSQKRPPKVSTLKKYLQLCRSNKTSMLFDNVCPHFMTSMWYIWASYEEILTKMTSGGDLSYPKVFTNIAKNLIAAVIHHEAFLKTSNFVNQLANAKKTFNILLR